MNPVVVDLPHHSGLGGALSYRHTERLAPGTLVQVPLGRREVMGLVWDPEVEPEQHGGQPEPPVPAAEPMALKAVSAVLELPPLSAHWRGLVSFAADYYRRGLGELALSVLPPELRKATPASLARRGARLAKSRAAAAASGAAAGLADRAADGPSLTPEQAAVLRVLADPSGDDGPAGPPPPVLLHGATGSGKTEVYLRLAERALARGQQVLVMVPEINLTPQLETRLRERFAGRILVTLHSGLTPAQRVNHWLQAHLGQADLLLGTRLSVMASLPRLGLIVVDEEHDPSYKQQEGARYSARDLAVYRGRLEGVPVILGSATPSLETWRHAQQGRYRLLRMPSRVGDGALPKVELVDLSLQPRSVAGGAGGSLLSTALVAAVQQRIDRGEQSLLLLNRRGYAPVLQCGACRWKSECPHCSAWRVFHKADRSLRCHHCGAAQRVPRACPDCGNLDLSAIGRGTERLEEQLLPLLRGRDGGPARILRIDADTTKRAGSLQSQLAQVHEGDVEVLVGTQMVAKGHDFRRVTLVAAVNPDGALFTSDFRAPERLFALLMQAAGRAGRDAEQAAHSRMIIQTAYPTHPLVQALRHHDYEAFAASQLQEREAVGLPPFSHLAVLRVEARTVEAAQAFLTDAGAAAHEALQARDLSIYPAVPAPVARVADLQRWQMLLESASRPALQAVLRQWSPQLLALRERHRSVVRWALDVDPLSL
ncbi:MAG: primosomal protein N' [Betaproteobacteria bacterium]|nr:primosomal protein N' [Betaproteobacteria bacterium]